MMQEDLQLLIEAGSANRIFIIIEGRVRFVFYIQHLRPVGCPPKFLKLSVVLSTVPLIYVGEDNGPAIVDRGRKQEQDLHNSRR